LYTSIYRARFGSKIKTTPHSGKKPGGNKMKFIGVKETAEITKQLKNQTWGPRVEIRYSVNNETSEVEVSGKWYMTDAEFSNWNEAWKYAGITRYPLSQKAIKELVLSALKFEQKRRK
jgi:hypothetical protein